jgi:hypothetical protein
MRGVKKWQKRKKQNQKKKQREASSRQKECRCQWGLEFHHKVRQEQARQERPRS